MNLNEIGIDNVVAVITEQDGEIVTHYWDGEEEYTATILSHAVEGLFEEDEDEVEIPEAEINFLFRLSEAAEQYLEEITR